MALVQKRISRKRIMILAGILIVFGGATLIMVFQNYFSGPDAPDIVLPITNTTTKDLPIYTDLGKDVLEDERLDDLTVHGDFPIKPGTLGRTNPFVESIQPEGAE